MWCRTIGTFHASIATEHFAGSHNAHGPAATLRTRTQHHGVTTHKRTQASSLLQNHRMELVSFRDIKQTVTTTARSPTRVLDPTSKFSLPSTEPSRIQSSKTVLSHSLVPTKVRQQFCTQWNAHWPSPPVTACGSAHPASLSRVRARLQQPEHLDDFQIAHQQARQTHHRIAWRARPLDRGHARVWYEGKKAWWVRHYPPQGEDRGVRPRFRLW
jgi:hypothetical protein